VIQDVGGLEPVDDCLGLEPTVGVALADLDGWPAPGDDAEVACRKMTMRPSEWAEKIASTTTSSSTIAAIRCRCGRRVEEDAALCAPDVRETCCWDVGLLRGAVRPWRDGACGDSGSNRSTESRPRGNKWNLPKPKPPSLGCPRSFTPQPLTASIQLRTRDSSLLATKSKKGRPMISVVVKKLSLEQ